MIIFVIIIIPTTLRADVPVAIRTTKNLEGTTFPFNYRSWQRSSQSYQNSVTVGVAIPVDHSFQSYQNSNKFKS